MIRAYLVDDEVLALERLSRMLTLTGRVELVGTNSDAVEAADEIRCEVVPAPCHGRT